MALPAEHLGDLPDPAQGPLLSIIVVSYNTAEMTVDALRSVYDTAGDVDFELFVYDNASTDHSVAAIEAAFPAADFPNLTLKPLTENLGFAKANNRAAEQARGRYILLLNPDTVVLPGAIQTLLDFARRCPEARIWGTRNILGDGSLDYGSCWGRMTPWSVFSYAVGLELIFPNSTLFKPEGYGGWDRGNRAHVDVVTGCFMLMRRADWAALKKKWRRLTAEGFALDGQGARLRWGIRALAMPASALVHVPRVLAHKGLGDEERARALIVLVRLRLARMVWMLKQAVTGRP